MITPVEHATMLIRSPGKTIYVDPVGNEKDYASFPKPDIILITHMHSDHFDPGLVLSLKTDDTAVIGPKTVIETLGVGQTVTNGESLTVAGVPIDVVPAYNLSAARTKFHPKGRDNGYVLTLDGKRVYISGDTEDTPEMRGLQNIDIAIFSVNLPYTMSVEQAAGAILEMKPKHAIPYHYRGQGGMSDLQKLKRLIGKDTDITVRLLDWYGKK